MTDALSQFEKQPPLPRLLDTKLARGCIWIKNARVSVGKCRLIWVCTIKRGHLLQVPKSVGINRPLEGPGNGKNYALDRSAARGLSLMNEEKVYQGVDIVAPIWQQSCVCMLGSAAPKRNPRWTISCTEKERLGDVNLCIQKVLLFLIWHCDMTIERRFDASRTYSIEVRYYRFYWSTIADNSQIQRTVHITNNSKASPPNS